MTAIALPPHAAMADSSHVQLFQNLRKGEWVKFRNLEAGDIGDGKVKVRARTHMGPIQCLI